MPQFLSAWLLGFLLQVASPPTAPEVDLAAITAQVTQFTSALEAKYYDKAVTQVAPLIARYVELGGAIAAADAIKDAASRDLATACRAAKKQILDTMERVVKDPRASAELQQKVLGAVGVQAGEGENLAVKALALGHISEVPETLASAIQALGSLRKPKYIENFEKHLRDTRAAVLNATAHAMGEYFGEKEAVRKRVVGMLILAYESAGSSVVPTGQQTSKRVASDSDALLLVRHEFQIALARLTGGVHFDRAKLWAEWFHDGKTAKWRDGLDKVDIKLDGLVPGPAPGAPKGH